VFTTAQGRPIDPANLTRTFITLLRKAGLCRIRFHDLRHSTATLLLEQGATSFCASKWRPVLCTLKPINYGIPIQALAIEIPLNPVDTLRSVSGSSFAEFFQCLAYLRKRKGAMWIMEKWIAWIRDELRIEVGRLRIVRDPYRVVNTPFPGALHCYPPDKSPEAGRPVNCHLKKIVCDLILVGMRSFGEG
jgi:hypothetical protein